MAAGADCAAMAASPVMPKLGPVSERASVRDRVRGLQLLELRSIPGGSAEGASDTLDGAMHLATPSATGDSSKRRADSARCE